MEQTLERILSSVTEIQKAYKSEKDLSDSTNVSDYDEQLKFNFKLGEIKTGYGLVYLDHGNLDDEERVVLYKEFYPLNEFGEEVRGNGLGTLANLDSFLRVYKYLLENDHEASNYKVSFVEPGDNISDSGRNFLEQFIDDPDGLTNFDEVIKNSLDFAESRGFKIEEYRDLYKQLKEDYV